MTNEDEHERKSAGDEEYQYPNAEYVAETTPPEEQEQPDKRVNFIMRLIQNNKRVTIVVVVVIVALIAFKLMNHYSKPKVIAITKAKPVVQQPVQQTLTQAQPNPEVMNLLSSLKQNAKESQTEIGQLQNQISDLRAQLTQAHQAQTQLNQSMVVLVEQLKQLTAEMHQKPSEKVKEAPPPPLVFYLKAVVPGRAWIVSNNGLSESVSVGDTIAQYGIVKVVDANRGMVLTSSGKVIGYGVNDH